MLPPLDDEDESPLPSLLPFQSAEVEGNDTATPMSITPRIAAPAGEEGECTTMTAMASSGKNERGTHTRLTNLWVLAMGGEGSGVRLHAEWAIAREWK
jgi:hypothetical protein